MLDAKVTKSQAFIQAQNISFSYDESNTNALSGINISIYPGQKLALLGPNGAGKSSLVSVLSGLLVPSQGRVTTRGCIALVPQQLSFYKVLTVKQNLAFFARCLGFKKKSLEQEIDRVIDQCNLQSLLNKPSGRCSGGEQRRLNLAIGLLGSPDVLFLDEPTVGIDAQSREWILDSLEQLAQQNISLIYVSHYFEETRRLCDSAVMLLQGQLVWQTESMINGMHKDIVNHSEEGLDGEDVFTSYLSLCSNADMLAGKDRES